MGPQTKFEQKPTFDAFCYLLSSCGVLFLYTIRVLLTFQAALRFKQKNTENNLAFDVEGAKGRES